MKDFIILIVAIVIGASGCSKITQVKVTYEATSAISEYNLYYLTPGRGDLANITVTPQSEQDVWRYSFLADEGDIVYVSGKYADINSTLKIMVKVDGKIYKQASNEGDTLKYLIVSGVVPYK